MTTGSSIRPWRVLYIARAPFVSGAERALETMLRHQDRARIQPMVVLGHDSPLRATLEAMGVPTAMVAMPKRSLGGWWSWRRSLTQMRQVIAQFQPDVLHANDVPSSQAMSVLGAKLKIPRVVHVRWGITAGDLGWWAREGTERVLCISHWIKNELRQPTGTPIADSELTVLQDAVDWPAMGGGEVQSPRSKVQGPMSKVQSPRSNVQSLGGDFGGFGGSPLPTSPASGRGEIASGGDSETSGGVMGFAGQLVDVKGLDLVIQGMGLMPADRRPRLLVAGKDTQTQGAYQSYLQQMAVQSGVADRIEWLGFVAEVNELYRRVDAMVCPSRLEPLGLVPMEASRWNVPTLASRLGGFLETIEHGRTGWLVEPTPVAWSQAMEVLWDRSQLNRAGQAARERTMRENSPMVYQQRLLKLYEEIGK